MKKALRIIGFPFRIILMIPILLYKFLISPILPKSCIYSPTCSSYAISSLKKHGVLAGTVLAVTRIFRCFGGLFTGGEDPVPEKFSFHHVGAMYKQFRRKRDTHDEDTE